MVHECDEEFSVDEMEHGLPRFLIIHAISEMRWVRSLLVHEDAKKKHIVITPLEQFPTSFFSSPRILAAHS